MPQRAFPAGSALIWLVIFLYAAQAAVRRAPERLRMKAIGAMRSTRTGERVAARRPRWAQRGTFDRIPANG